MTTINEQQFNILSDVISQWLKEDSRNYAMLADMLRKEDIEDRVSGVVILELMSAEKLSDWRDVLAGLRQRQLASDVDVQNNAAQVQNAQQNSVWDFSFQKWEKRYHDAGKEVWPLGSEAVVDVRHAVRYYREFCGEGAAKVLDIGGGDGRNALYLADQGFDVTVVEAAKSGLENLSQRLSEQGLFANLVHADLREYEYPQDIDLLVASYIMHLIPDPLEHLRQWQAAVRPGGFAVIINRGRRANYDPAEHNFFEAGFLKHVFQLAGWRIFSVREEENWRNAQIGMFRHSAVVVQKPDNS